MVDSLGTPVVTTPTGVSKPVGASGRLAELLSSASSPFSIGLGVQVRLWPSKKYMCALIMCWVKLAKRPRPELALTSWSQVSDPVVSSPRGESSGLGGLLLGNHETQHSGAPQLNP